METASFTCWMEELKTDNYQKKLPMKTLISYLLFISIIDCCRAQRTSVTLQQAVETAVTNNLTVKQRELQMESAEVYLKEARAQRYPNLSAFANHGINQGRSIDPFTNSFINENVNYASYGLNTGVTIFNGLGIYNNIRANALGYEAARWELQQEKDNITLNVILAYLQVLNNTDLLAQAGNTNVVTQQQVNRLEILNRQGAIAPALLYDLRGQLASDQLALINTRNNLNASKLLLSQLMNIPFDSAMAVERISVDQFNPEYPATVESIYQTAMQQLALMKAAQLRTQSAEKAIKAVKGDLYPSLALNGQATTNYSSAATQNIFLNSAIDSIGFVTINGNNTPVKVMSNNFTNEKIKFNEQLSNNVFTTFNLALRIPIFNNLQTRTRVRQAQITQKNYQYIESTARIQLKQNIEQAYFNMTAARERYLALLEQVNAFSESFHAAEVRFNAGVGTTVDYIIAKNNMDRANINLISARYDFLLRTKVLDYYQAKPLW